MVGDKQPGELLDELLDALLLPKVFRAFRIAIQPSKLIIGLLAVAIISLSGWVMDFASCVPVVRNDAGRISTSEADVYVSGGDLALYADSTTEREGEFAVLWHFGSTRFHNGLVAMFNRDFAGLGRNFWDCIVVFKWAFLRHYIYSPIFFCLVLVIISITGGALSRMAAVQFARDEKLGVFGALKFGVCRMGYLLCALLSPVAILLVLGIGLLVIGLIGNIPRAGEIIMVLMTWPAVVLGALITILAIGIIGGTHLMFPAVCYDGSDTFDAINRSFSYTYSRPWRFAMYTIAAAVYGAICYVFLRFFAFVMLWSMHRFLEIGIWTHGSSGTTSKLEAIWPEPTFLHLMGSPTAGALNWSECTAAFILKLLLLWIVLGLLVSFILSFYFSSLAIIYGLLRKKVDDTDLADLYVPYESDEADIEDEPDADA